jgi:hypothetical protein
MLMCDATAAQEATTTQSTATQPALTARVDPRVELMSIIFRLAGNPEYNMDNSASPYADDVEAHFGKYRGHAAVLKAKQMRKQHGVGYDAVMRMAILVEDAATLKEVAPLEELRTDLDKRWTVENARKFLGAARDFVQDSDFPAFVAAHEPLYAAAATRMNEVLARLEIQKWFDSFFGARAGTHFELVVGLLNGGGNYGPALRYPDGRQIYYSIIGCWRFDERGHPVFSDALAGTITHEFCHSYTNPLVDSHVNQLRSAGQRLFAGCKAQMQKQAYGNWETMMRESLVRACVVRYVEATQGQDAARLETREQARRGFTWVGGLADCFAEYEQQREHYSTLEAYMPKIVEFFDTYARKSGATAPGGDAAPPR